MAARATKFADVVELADQLSLDEQETLLDVLRRRTAEQRRSRIIRDVKEAREAFKRGNCRPVTPADLLREARS